MIEFYEYHRREFSHIRSDKKGVFRIDNILMASNC